MLLTSWKSLICPRNPDLLRNQTFHCRVCKTSLMGRRNDSRWGTSGFRLGVNEIFALLGCNAALIVIYWHFGTTCLSRLKSQAGTFLTLEDGTDRLSRNVVNYQSTLRNIPEEWKSQILRIFPFYYSFKIKFMIVFPSSSTSPKLILPSILQTKMAYIRLISRMRAAWPPNQLS
jgi:hypothetical protein